MNKYTLKQLKDINTIMKGQTDDLKVQTKTMRIWLSRMTIEDGMEYNNQVTVEYFKHPAKRNKQGGVIIAIDTSKPEIWETVDQYEAK